MKAALAANGVEGVLTMATLGGKVAAFDMRNPDRIYMRVPGRAQQQTLESGT